MVSPQIGRLHAGDNANFRCWLRVNSKIESDSNVFLNLLQVIMATDATAGVGVEAIQPALNELLVSAIIFSMEVYR